MKVEAYIPSTWKRLIAHWIDSLLMFVFYIPLLGVFWKLIFGDGNLFISWKIFLYLLIIPALYEMIFLLLMSTTPGKWLWGLRVTPKNDISATLDWRQCLMRPLVGRLYVFFGWAPYALALFRYDRTHLPDWIAETRVVQNTPRKRLPRIRWFVGSLAVLILAAEGVRTAHVVIRSMDWKSGEVNISRIYTALTLEDLADEDALDDFEF